MKKVTTNNYMKEKWYPRIVRVVSEILAEKDVVTPIQVFVRLDLLKPSMVEEWRLNRIPFLEKVIRCNLSNACRILRVLRLHSLERGLKPSPTDYRKWGKGRKIPLRFSKFEDPNLEAAYSTHYLTSRLANAKARPDGFTTSPAGSGPVVVNDTANSTRRAIRDERGSALRLIGSWKSAVRPKAPTRCVISTCLQVENPHSRTEAQANILMDYVEIVASSPSPPPGDKIDHTQDFDQLII